MTTPAAPATPDVDELLAHTDWLLGLARALVGDAGAADVVQQTYEVALKKPPRLSGPLRPWLGGVARNIARMTTRGRVRREQREEVASDAAVLDSAAVPTPEELVAQVELHQQVARIVLELPEPLRGTLLLRYFANMSAADIARAHDIPAATVRSRLQDALARVRASLDTQHGGDRRRWVAVLAPAGAASSTLAKGLLVKTGLKIVVAIAVAIALVFGTRWLGWWGDPSSDAAKPPQIAAPTPHTKAAAATAAAQPAAMRPMPAFHDDDPIGNLRLEGQVIDEQDHGVGGARVAIDANPTMVVETEADGSFVFDKLIPRDYRIEATAGDGYAGPTRLRLGAKVEPVTLRMRRGGEVDVVTVDTAGKPIAGASVELRSTLTWHATTDAKGVAVLRGVGNVWAPLAVSAPGFAPAAQILAASGSPVAPQRVVVTLASGAAIAGRVVDDTGNPVEGARVVATSASEPFPVVDPRRDGVLTGPNGAFQIPAVAAGTWRLTATQGDHGPASSAPLTVDGTHARTDVELVLAAGGVVRGVVRDKAGQPVASADVRVVMRGNVWWRARRQAFTGADGTFAITGLPRRLVDLVAFHETGASGIASADLAAVREHDVTLTLELTGAITGTVVDRSGAPIGDAQVTVEPEWSGGLAEREAWGVRGDQETVTDQGGAFRFSGLPDSPYRVRAARPGASEAAMSLATPVIARPNGDPLRIVLPADGRLVGKVAFGDGKVPLRFAIAVAATTPMPFASADGAFAVTAAAGKHVIVVSGPGFAEKRIPDVAIVEGKDTDVGTITVVAGRSVSGRVLDDTGVPIPHAKVAAGSLLSGGGKELYIPDESVNAKDTETDDAGHFSIEGFGQGQIVVVAGKDGLGRSASVRLPPGPDSAQLELVVQKTTGFDGAITRNGAPVADTVVIANPVGATRSNFFVTSGADGTFAFDALAAGSYIVYPMIGGGGGRAKNTYARTVEVVHGKRAHVDIDTTPGPLALEVHVKNADGTPAIMATVIAIESRVSPTSLDDLRDGGRFPEMLDHVVPIYFRTGSGAIELTGLRPALHTVCSVIVSFPPSDETSSLPMSCSQIKLDAATPKAKLDIALKPAK